MKNRILKQSGITLLTVLLLGMFSTVLFAEKLQYELEMARMKYERLYKQYVDSLNNTVTGTKSSLAEEVAAAKRQYETVKKRFEISQSTKDSVKKAADQVKETVEKVFSSGSSEASAPVAESSKTLPGYDGQKISIDGDNYCGQFAMTSAFHGMGIPHDPQTAYKTTNPAGIFTSPPAIVEYLNMNGVDAIQRHNASLNDLTAKIDAGLPVIVLVNSGSGTPHWVTIYGYTTDSSGNVTGVKMRDSYWGTSSGHTMDIEKFKAAWSDPVGNKLPNSLLGYSNLMIDIKGSRTAAQSPAAFNFNFNTAAEDNMAGGVNDVVTGFKRIAPMQLAGGIVKCVLGIPGTVVSVAGKGISIGGDKIIDWGKAKLNNGGFGNTLLGGSAVVAGSVTKAAGWVAKASGNLLSSVACVAGNFTKKLGYVFAR
ncbi:MAG: hypothetical protein CVV41_00885 [Candidatus Riflebacteria bacterium HGW-Riflebacteria-1]|nr:MAG: hypothetical protein CVV41_00885 [Candidatus Riflebacteria bacterium HGW-Riflebacteria-1]